MSSTPVHPNKMQTTESRSFVRNVLPWLVAGAMLLVYLATLDTHLTPTSLVPLTRATGQDWRPVYIAPLTWLVSLPVRGLSVGAQLIGLNLLGAICAALSLALLARAVAILPHDRTQLQRDRATDANAFLSLRLAWVPVLFAVLVCGLQRSFWEQAVINTGETLDLLIFAYCVRALLEYRLQENIRWLYKLAFVFGLGVTNNFAMIAFFPALMVALAWIKGLRFFNLNFLARMFLLGLAGLSLYLLLPLVQSHEGVTFWQALKTNLVWQKQFIMGFPRWRAGWIGIYALLPLLFVGLRWSSSFGDSSPIGSVYATAAAQILHAGLLGFCLYIAFDPPSGPREFGLGLVYLPCYFLAALSIGYFTGFLLLVFSPGPSGTARRTTYPAAIGLAVTALVCGGALFVSARLLVQNYPEIRLHTSPALHAYANALVNSLPEKASAILSDDPVRLQAVSLRLGSEGQARHLLLDTAALTEPAYHRFLQSRYGVRWPKVTLEPGNAKFTSGQVVQLLSDLSQKFELTYLHPSFGYFFETFYAEPYNMVYILKPYAPNATEAPLLEAAAITRQNNAWNALSSGPLKELKSTLAALPTDPKKRYQFSPVFVAAYYARALNSWGVDLQRAGRFDAAAPFFNEALLLNPDNVAALINREANAVWRKDHKRLAAFSKEAEEKLKLYPGVNALLGACGPVDQPDFSLEMASTFLQAAQFRQAAQLVNRALAYAPEDLTFQTAMANVEMQSGQADRALARLATLRPKVQSAEPALQIEIARIESGAYYYMKNDFATARTVLEKIKNRFPEEEGGYNALIQLHLVQAEKLRTATNPAAASLEMTNALRVVQSQIRMQPKSGSAYFNQGNLHFYLGDYDRSIASFTQVLELQKDNSAALLNRAMAKLQSKKLNDAKSDYTELLRRFTTTNHRVYYGLGEIAYQQQDWREARDRYEQYLRYAATAPAAERELVRKRLEEVKKKKA